MNEQHNEQQTTRQNILVETTDALEAIDALKGWKNFLFIIILIALVALQVSFWLANLGSYDGSNENQQLSLLSQTIDASEEDASEPEDSNQIDKAAERAATEPNEPVPDTDIDEKLVDKEPVKPVEKADLPVSLDNLQLVVRASNFALILASLLYCLTMLLALKVSMVGRLGGINHIIRAFYLSLVMFVLILPWQQLFAPVVTGMIFLPGRLVDIAEFTHDNSLATGLFYLRYTGYWLVIVLLLLKAQSRAASWLKATLRRVEVV